MMRSNLGTLIHDRRERAEKALTLAVYLERWLDGRAALRARPSTVAAYRVSCARITAVAGDHILRDLTPQAVQAVIAALVAKGYAPSTIVTTRRVFSIALRDAVRDRLLADNPVPDSTAPRAPRIQRRVLAAPEAMRLLRRAEEAGDSFWPLWVVLLNTGLRISEALGLRWGDVDLPTRTLTVAGQLTRTRGANPRFQWGPRKPKAGGALVLPLTAAAADALRVRRDEQDADRRRAGAHWQDEFGGLVFTSPLGRPHHAPHVYQRFQRALARAELPASVRVHDLRHSTAMLLTQSEVPLELVSRLLGHSSIGITHAVYTHDDLTLMRAALKRLEDALERPPEG